MSIKGIELNFKLDRLIIAVLVIISLTILMLYNKINDRVFTAAGGWLLGFYFGQGRAIVNNHKNK